MDIDLFRKMILANEVGGDMSLAYKFSDPDGVRTGKSGWSFGVCQFDIANNRDAAACLRMCGFSEQQIEGLKRQDIDVRPLNRILEEHADIIAAWDEEQLKGCLEWPLKLCGSTGISLDNPAVLYHLADYHNQLRMDRNGQLHRHLLTLGRPPVPQDILDFKLSTAWGRKRPDDVRRRYNNIQKIVEGTT